MQWLHIQPDQLLQYQIRHHRVYGIQAWIPDTSSSSSYIPASRSDQGYKSNLLVTHHEPC
jgi:hypothetical protein